MKPTENQRIEKKAMKNKQNIVNKKNVEIQKQSKYFSEGFCFYGYRSACYHYHTNFAIFQSQLLIGNIF